MKTKLKKWHVVLMSFVALVFAIFTSLFNLKADPVDDETGEVLMDNWELSTVFYDSTVDTGVTPLTEIVWDASDGSYWNAPSRVITVQINYKNDSAVTTYQAGELEISIPNIAYNAGGNKGANLSIKTTVGANDATHTGYDWTVKSVGEYYVFTNTNIIEEKTNFEGSIQIVYEITPYREYDLFRDGDNHMIYDIPDYQFIEHEWFMDECTHRHKLTLQACLKKVDEVISVHHEIINPETTITSPNWPQYYEGGLTLEEDYWEYTSPNLENLYLVFDETSYLDNYIDRILIYGNEGLLYTLTGTEMRNKAFYIEGNYVKIAMLTNYSWHGKGFSVDVGELKTTITYPEKSIVSNSIVFDYKRVYEHPWEKQDYPLVKSAYKISAYDGLPQGADNYIWVKYIFNAYNYDNEPINSPQHLSYPYIPVESGTLYIKDKLSEGCIAYDLSGNALELNENNEITLNSYTKNGNNYQCIFFVGYPKSIYNEENNNLNIVNTGQMYGKYIRDKEETFLSEASVNVDLSKYEFNYTGELYGISKKKYSYSDELYYQNIVAETSKINTTWHILPSVRYTGDELTVRIGDDLLFSKNKNGENIKLSDNDYYFTEIRLDKLYNCNGIYISPTKYPIKLFVRYKGTTEYVQYGSDLTSYSTFKFTKEDGVVGFYYQIENMREGLQTDSSYYSYSGYPYSYLYCKTNFTPQYEIPEQGTIHNFTYLNVFKKDDENNLILLNEPSLNSYSTQATERDIATFDITTYGHYMQRAVANTNWSFYALPEKLYNTDSYKKASQITQNAEKEIFTGSFSIYGGPNAVQHGEYPIPKDLYFEQCKEKQLGITYIQYTDLLPEGMNLTSNKKEIIDSMNLLGMIAGNGNTFSYYYTGTYNLDGEVIFSSNDEVLEYLKERTTITIIENYENSNRTQLDIYIDLSDQPFVIVDHSSIYGSDGLVPYFTYNYEISYDSYLEYGKSYLNQVYVKTNHSSRSSSSTINITSVVSTHQDVTTYVQTDKNNFTTGTADSSINTDYQYKLRARTGSADITNLIIYTNLEEAQPERQRWKGEFLSIDTSYAENKGYTVKPYYSENPEAGNLYNEDGTLNSDWKEYVPDTPELIANGLKVTFNNQFKTESVNFDYLEIYYVLNETTYKLGKWGGTELAGKTINIPSTDFYLYWRTDGSGSSYYGFSIDSIVPDYIENTNTTTGTIPSYTPEEIENDVYPDSAFNSYTHGYYGNNVNKLWHYSYTNELPIIQEYQEETPKDKVKSLAFEYLDTEGNPAILPANSLTYVLIKMKSPADENETRLARMDCWTQWNALDEFDQPVDFITGINSNVVKVALPNSVDEDSSPSISLKFTKEIQGSDSEFENMKLDKAAQQLFLIRLTNLTANDDGSYNQVTALLKNDQELIISQIPIGTYLLEELGDNYFDFVEFAENNEEDIVIEGITFEKTAQGYIITVSEDLTENIEFNIKVTNEIEQFRPYEDKDNKENLFLKNKIEENS